MVSSIHEHEFLQAMKESLIANSSANIFINSSDKQGELADKIAFRITRLRYMSIEQAKVYGYDFYELLDSKMPGATKMEKEYKAIQYHHEAF